MPSAGDALLPVSARALDQARFELLRRRLAWFRVAVALILVFNAVAAALVAARWHDRPLTRPQRVSLVLMGLMGLAIVAVPFVRRFRIRDRTLKALVRRVSIIVVAAVIGQTAGAQVLAPAATLAARALGLVATTGNVGPMFPLLLYFMLIHSAASLIIPWTAWEATRPPLVLAGLNLLVFLIPSSDTPDMIVAALAGVLIASAPGILIAAFRTGRFRERIGTALLRSDYREVQRELASARRIHERLFPAPRPGGPVRFAYSYEPMRQIGGDYLDATIAPDGAATLVVIDVTGHGIPAALAVNRLHGEIKRLLRENPDASPREVVVALGDYVHLTLADESVFATAAVLRLDPAARTLRCCNAGHPPLVVLRSGALELLEPTAMMLGPLPGDELGAEETELLVSPGDLVVAYSDGAFECADADGRQLGLAGLRPVVESALREEPDPQAVTDRIHRAVLAHRDGPAADDTLIVCAGLGTPVPPV